MSLEPAIPGGHRLLIGEPVKRKAGQWRRSCPYCGYRLDRNDSKRRWQDDPVGVEALEYRSVSLEAIARRGWLDGLWCSVFELWGYCERKWCRRDNGIYKLLFVWITPMHLTEDQQRSVEGSLFRAGGLRIPGTLRYCDWSEGNEKWPAYAGRGYEPKRWTVTLGRGRLGTVIEHVIPIKRETGAALLELWQPLVALAREHWEDE